MRSSPVRHWNNAKNRTKIGLETKNLANNYQIWTLRFLPFPILKSLALSTELVGGLRKNFSSSRARYASTLLTQKFYCSNSKNSKTQPPKHIDKIQKIIEILIKNFGFFRLLLSLLSRGCFSKGDRTT